MTDSENVKRLKIDVPNDVKWLIQFTHFDDRIDVGIVGMVHYDFEEHNGHPQGKIHVQFPDGCGYTIIREPNPFVGHG